MLDFFTIFSKGGIVLWYIQNTSTAINSSVNALIKSVILQERVGNVPYMNESFAIHYHMDNEFDLVFVVGYQKILQLSYVDKFLTSLAREFRDKYKDDLTVGNVTRDFTDFSLTYNSLLKSIEEDSKEEKRKGREMRSFQESNKSQKKVSSLIISSNKTNSSKPGKAGKPTVNDTANITNNEMTKVENGNSPPEDPAEPTPQDQIELNKMKLKTKLAGKKKSKSSDASTNSPTSVTSQGKKVKTGRKWAGQCTAKEAAALDYSSQPSTSNGGHSNNDSSLSGVDVKLSSTEAAELRELRGKLKSGELGDIEVDSDSDDLEDDFEEEQVDQRIMDKNQNKSKSSGGMFGLLRNLVSGVGGGKALTKEVMDPVLEQLRDRLIAKNVASEIAQKLCDSVCMKLEGSQIGTFERITSKVRQALEETCTQLLSSKRRLDVLRDVMEAQRQGRPYVIVFCGVNGVGKSTNLAKIAFWLVEKGMRVLVAACDTFRSGAVEQLRTHVQKLNFIHPSEQHNGRTMVELYEKGYGKDSAAIAMSAINSARDQKFDVVLVDTAGRMQDNEPLMRSLAKLIVINNPDLVLFVGEALVGNEAVDQLVKFNQALADNSSSHNPHTIDGIVLTKFDTIDDKVGAAVSMTYISGQPIVFVGTGQTYADLRQLSAPAVVKALMK